MTGLLTLPLAPVRGTMWIAERLLEEAERELNDPALVEQRLLDAETRFERGESAAQVAAGWSADVMDFERRRAAVLIY